MLDQELYTREKLKEIDASRRVRQAVPPAGKPALAPLARPLGRALHGLGHRLEVWAEQRDAPDLELRGKTG